MKRYFTKRPKRRIAASTDIDSLAQNIRYEADSKWGLAIDTPDMIAFADDDDSFYVIDINKATQFLTSSLGQEYIEEAGDPYHGLFDAYSEDENCGVTRLSFEYDRKDIARTFTKFGLDIPDWVFD